jgi:hypothetical protein
MDCIEIRRKSQSSSNDDITPGCRAWNVGDEPRFR